MLGHVDGVGPLGEVGGPLFVRVVATDLAWVEQPVGIEGSFQVPERTPELVAVQLAVPLGPGPAVAVFPGDAAAEVDDDVGDSVGDGLHLGDAVGGLGVDQRADVEYARAGVGVERGERAVLLEDFPEPTGVLWEVFGGHRTVLDEGDVFGVGGPRE